MIIIKKYYYYFFYKFYKFGEWSPSVFPSDFTATFAISCLEVLFLASIKFYYIEFFDHNDTFDIASIQTIVALSSIFFINYFAFLHNEKWKSYVKNFDKLPKRENQIGTFIVIGIVIFIIANLAFAFHVMGQMTGID